MEDEVFAMQYLKRILRSLGHNFIFEASNAKDALDIINNNAINLVFMDINLNDSVDGITCALMMNVKQSIPLIYTTAYADSDTISDASYSNIFGYLIKPFEPSDVEASLSVAIKRMVANQEVSFKQQIKKTNEKLNLGENQIFDLSSKTLFIDTHSISLTNKELNLLYILCLNLNQNVSYTTLQETVWNYKNTSSSAMRDVVLRLRKKAPKLHIESISSFGYILKKL